MTPNTEIQTLNHEAIRQVGTDMARYLGVLAELQDDRELAVERLNECAAQVPYATLFAEDTRLADEIEAATVDHSDLDQSLRAEMVRLDEAARTFARRMPTKHKAAEALVKQKKEEARQEVEAQKALLDAPRLKLESERAELQTTIDAVSAAWPTAPYSADVLEAVAETQQEETTGEGGYDEPAELRYTLEAHLKSRRHRRRQREQQATQPQSEEEGTPGPHVELAGSIPVLSDRLKPQASEHMHIHGEIETAQETLLHALSKPEAERSEQQGMLLKAIYVLRTNFLEKPNDLDFLQVYEASDIIRLAEQLHAFSRKNRPDFEGLEGRILETAAVRRPMQGRQVPQPIKSATERMNEDAPNRKGMQWASLVKYANRASDTLRDRFLAGGDRNLYLKDYVINVVDRSGTKPVLSWVYQFVADDFAFGILGERRTAQQAEARERFMENCGIIADWLEETRQLLDQLPVDFRLRRHHQKRQNFRMRQRRAEYDSSPAGPRIHNMVKDIYIRRDGTGDSKTLRHKPMRFDPVGALNHQLRLGHMVDALRAELRVYDAPTEGRTEEITPFA